MTETKTVISEVRKNEILEQLKQGEMIAERTTRKAESEK